MAPGDLIGFVKFLEAAIARQSSELLSFPTEVISSLIQSDPSFCQYLGDLLNPCELSTVLSERFKKQNPPPVDAKQKILDVIDNTAKNKNNSSAISVLSSVIPGFEELVGSVIDSEQRLSLQSKSKIPIRCLSLCLGSDVNFTADGRPDQNINSTKPEINNTIQSKSWSYNKTFDLVELGLKEASSTADLQGFKLIKGKGLVQANLATLRMAANAYGAPCPVDVIEKALEGAVERAGSVPIQAMGQLAETMGFQTQLGAVKYLCSLNWNCR